MKFWPTQCEQTWVFSSPALQIYAFWVSSVFLFPSDWQSERWMDAEIKSTYRRWQSFCQSWNVYLRTATWEKTESSWFKLLCLWISVLQKLFINQYQQNREIVVKKHSLSTCIAAIQRVVTWSEILAASLMLWLLKTQYFYSEVLV